MSIYADKKNGKLTGRFRVEVQLGELRKRGRFDNHADAVAAEKQWKAALARGEDIGARESHTGTRIPTTLSELLQKARMPLWNGSTHGKYSAAQIERIIERFGNIKLNDVTTAWVDDVHDWLRDELELAEATINRYWSAMSAVLGFGLEREYVKKMPKFEWYRPGEGRIRTISEDEENAMYAWLAKSQASPSIAAFIAVAIDTGCRRGELLLAQPGQINNGRLTLWGTTTKSGRTRTISLTPRARKLLAEHLPWRFTRSQLRYWWDAMVEGLGIADDDFVLHACRHTCATRLLEKGVDVRTVQEWMGHATITTTQKYLHTTTARLDAAAALLSEAVGDDPRLMSGEVTKLPKVGERTAGEQSRTSHETQHVA
jgi:integrase